MAFFGDDNLAGGAVPPPRHLGLVDGEAGRIGDVKARSVTGGAVDIDHHAAVPADEVMVVVPDADFEERGSAGRLDAPDQVSRVEGVEGVVNGLRGHAAELDASAVDDGFDVKVFARSDRVEHGEALSGHPQPGPTQPLGGSGGHTTDSSRSLELVKNRCAKIPL